MAERDHNPSLESRVVRLEVRDEQRDEQTRRLKELEKRIAEIEMMLQRIQWNQEHDASPAMQRLATTYVTADPAMVKIVISALVMGLLGLSGANWWFGD